MAPIHMSRADPNDAPLEAASGADISHATEALELVIDVPGDSCIGGGVG